MAIERNHTTSRMSQCVVHGDTVYLAGQVADDGDASAGDQTRQVLEKIDGLLAEVDHVLGRHIGVLRAI